MRLCHMELISCVESCPCRCTRIPRERMRIVSNFVPYPGTMLLNNGGAPMEKRKRPNYIQPDLQPEDLAKRLYQARPKARKKVHHGPMKILRTESYKGHNIRIETTYKITVDRKAVTGHLDVTNSGQVHYHPLPNLQHNLSVPYGTASSTPRISRAR